MTPDQVWELEGLMFEAMVEHMREEARELKRQASRRR